MDDSTLSTVAESVADSRGNGTAFRLGLYLGLTPNVVDNILEESNLTPWQRAMNLLTKWRDGCVAEEPRTELARVLQRVRLGRLASSLDPRVTAEELPSFITRGNPDFTACELEEISKSVGEEWGRLGVRLGVPAHTMATIRARREEPALSAFRCLWAWYEAGQEMSRNTLAHALREINKGRLASQIT